MDTGTREFKRIPRRFRFTFGVVDAVAGCGCTPFTSDPEDVARFCFSGDGSIVGSGDESGNGTQGQPEKYCARDQSIFLVNGPTFRNISSVQEVSERLIWGFILRCRVNSGARSPSYSADSCGRRLWTAAKTRLPVASWPNRGIRVRDDRAVRRHSTLGRVLCLPPSPSWSSLQPDRASALPPDP